MAVTAPKVLDVLAPGARLYAECWGEQGPCVVLAHGFGGSARNFRPQARALAAECRVVVFDARGHARSEAPSAAEAYQPDCFVEDLRAVIDRTGEGRAIVGGLSMGAGVALRFALAHPDRVRALALMSFPRSAADPGHVSWALGFADALAARGLESAGREYIWGRLEPREAALVRRGFEEHEPHALAHVLRQWIAVQPSPESMAGDLGRLSVPALIVAGAEDPGSLRPSRALARLLPRASLLEVEGGGHVVNLTHPDLVTRALRDFVSAAANA